MAIDKSVNTTETRAKVLYRSVKLLMRPCEEKVKERRRGPLNHSRYNIYNDSDFYFILKRFILY